jgi:hypothetical protein
MTERIKVGDKVQSFEPFRNSTHRGKLKEKDEPRTLTAIVSSVHVGRRPDKAWAAITIIDDAFYGGHTFIRDLSRLTVVESKRDVLSAASALADEPSDEIKVGDRVQWTIEQSGLQPFTRWGIVEKVFTSDETGARWASILPRGIDGGVVFVRPLSELTVVTAISRIVSPGDELTVNIGSVSFSPFFTDPDITTMLRFAGAP